MEITRDLFLSDARAPYFTVTLTSRDLQAHRILTDLTPEEHERIEEALTAAGTTIAETLKTAHDRSATRRETKSFGCGT